jgi:predicted small secreted protein
MSTTTKLALALLALAGATVGACNTIKGAGQDVSAAGKGIENAADDVQDDMEDDMEKENR